MDDRDQYGHPRIPHRGYYEKQYCDERRRWVEKFCTCELKHVGQWWRDEGSDDSCSCKKLKGNIENPIGLVKVPVGLAGPLIIHGHFVNGYTLCPFATTEGALVASATRGAALLTRAGGVTSRVLEQVMIRSPSFRLYSVDDAEVLFKWIQGNRDALQKQIKLFSRHAQLTDIRPHRFGSILIVQFNFQTGEAAGQNMVTMATWHSCKWLMNVIEKEIPTLKIKNFYIESNASGDKKMAFSNLMSTRGVHAIAEAWIPESVIRDTLKTTVEDLLRTYRMMQFSSTRIGCLGFNLNVANIIAAVFTATGQDIACTIESASAQFILEPAKAEEIQKYQRRISFEPNSVSALQESRNEDGVYACIVLPSLVLGSIGGGTSLATQKECLQLMGCHGMNGVARLGEIIAGFALGLDLSTLGAISNGTFAASHERLGRNRPENGLKEEHLNREFFENVVGEKGTLVSWEPFNVNTGDSIISELTKAEIVKKVGHFGITIHYKDIKGQISVMKVVIKSKPTDVETCNMINKMALGCGFTLASIYERNKAETGFRQNRRLAGQILFCPDVSAGHFQKLFRALMCQVREIELARLNNQYVRTFSPAVYHTIQNTKKDIHVIVMDFIDEEQFTLFNTVHDISVWREDDMKVVLRDLAQIHASFMQNHNNILSSPWLEEMGREKMVSLRPLWLALLQHAGNEFPQFWNKKWVKIMENIVENIEELWTPLLAAQKTIVHNDCNPRNLCLRLPISTSFQKKSSSVPFSDSRILCIYDWELSRVDVPQHDVVEFLAFVLPPSTGIDHRLSLIEFYRKHLEYYSGISFPKDRFLAVYNVASLDFAVNRLLMYTMAHTYKDYHFLPRVVKSHFSYIVHQIEAGNINLDNHTRSKL